MLYIALFLYCHNNFQSFSIFFPSSKMQSSWKYNTVPTACIVIASSLIELVSFSNSLFHAALIHLLPYSMLYVILFQLRHNNNNYYYYYYYYCYYYYYYYYYYYFYYYYYYYYYFREIQNKFVFFLSVHFFTCCFLIIFYINALHFFVLFCCV